MIDTAVHTGNKQIAINMFTTIVSYVISLGISFLLTPYIISRLGTAAYGFLGLSNNIIGYTSLITVALNSMSQRFVALHYHAGEYVQANRYLTSTALGNCCLALFIVALFGIITLFLERLINIPPELVGDVKFLFTLLYVNVSVNLCTNFMGMSAFIKNRVDITNIFGVIGNVLRVMAIIIAYGFFPAHIWYIGAAALVCTMYGITVNYNLYRHLTPELHIRRALFNVRYVWEMTKEGAWNILSQFSSILNQGLELLLANLFVGAYYMGILSISKTLPFLLVGIFGALGSNFHPEVMRFYALGDTGRVQSLLLKGIRLLAFVATIPCAGILAYADIFYKAWLPNQDSSLLYHVTVITMVWLTVTLPTQTLWYVFTITKTVRKSSLMLIRYGLLNCALTILALQMIDDDVIKLFAIVGIQSVLGISRFIWWLPLFSAKVLGFPRYTFFKSLMRYAVVTAILSIAGLVFKYICIDTYNWTTLVAGAVFTTFLGVIIGYLFILTASDKKFILSKFNKYRLNESR